MLILKFASDPGGWCINILPSIILLLIPSSSTPSHKILRPGSRFASSYIGSNLVIALEYCTDLPTEEVGDQRRATQYQGGQQHADSALRRGDAFEVYATGHFRKHERRRDK